jgi:hypothetical protein
MRTAEVIAHPLPQFIGRELPVRLDDGPRLPWTHFGSIGFSHGALIGSPHTRMRHPPRRRTRRLCRSTHRRTRLLTCQAALSQTRTNTRFRSAASFPHTHPRYSSVVALTGRPSANRSIIPPVSVRSTLGVHLRCRVSSVRSIIPPVSVRSTP